MQDLSQKSLFVLTTILFIVATLLVFEALSQKEFFSTLLPKGGSSEVVRLLKKRLREDLTNPTICRSLLGSYDSPFILFNSEDHSLSPEESRPLQTHTATILADTVFSAANFRLIKHRNSSPLIKSDQRYQILHASLKMDVRYSHTTSPDSVSDDLSIPLKVTLGPNESKMIVDCFSP